MTSTQKLLARAAGLSRVHAGQLIEARLDWVMGNDITSPVAIEAFEKTGFEQVFDPEHIIFVLDHYTPCKDIASARLCQCVRQFANRHGIRHLYDTGKAGIEHALIPEQGLIAPGECMVGADSHTCTYGALGAFSTGIGSTDLAAAMATGTCWFRVPAAISVILEGSLPRYVSGKDVILHLIGRIGVDGARYCSLEFSGPGVHALSMDDRFTMANMAVEAGAKNAMFPVDDRTEAYLNGRVRRPWKAVLPDADAVYEQTLHIDLSALEPTIALPHQPSHTVPARQARDLRIDQAVIGSCTNGRMQDMRTAAEIMKGRHVADSVRCLIIPATQDIYLQCLQEGLIEIFVRAGCAVSTPTCGPCLGGHMGCLAEGERAVATTNRNFVGRMGARSSEVILASPAIAAASAVAGHIALPDDLPESEG